MDICFLKIISIEKFLEKNKWFWISFKTFIMVAIDSCAFLKTWSDCHFKTKSHAGPRRSDIILHFWRIGAAASGRVGRWGQSQPPVHRCQPLYSKMFDLSVFPAGSSQSPTTRQRNRPRQFRWSQCKLINNNRPMFSFSSIFKDFIWISFSFFLFLFFLASFDWNFVRFFFFILLKQCFW